MGIKFSRYRSVEGIVKDRNSRYEKQDVVSNDRIRTTGGFV